MVRRRADRELFELIEKKTGMKPYQLLRQRKRRQVIRHTCKANLLLDTRRLLSIDMESPNPPTEDSEQFGDEFSGMSGMLDEGLTSPPPGEADRATLSLKTRVLDLSEGGASLFTTYNVAPGQRARLQVRLFDGSQIESTVEVRWTKHKEAKGGYVLGVQHVEMDAPNKKLLKTFLRELDANLGMM